MLKFALAAAAALVSFSPAAAAPSGDWRYVMHGGKSADRAVALFVDHASITPAGKKGKSVRTYQVEVVRGKVYRSFLINANFDCDKPFTQRTSSTVYDEAGRALGTFGEGERKMTDGRQLNGWAESYVCKPKYQTKAASFPAAATPETFALDVASGSIKVPIYRPGVWIGPVRMF